jgi:GH24 family phage-related lysozyme (muramidase)
MNAPAVRLVAALLGGALLAASVVVAAEPEPPSPNEEPVLVPRIFLETWEPLVIPRRIVIRKVYPPGIELTTSMEGFREHLYDDPAGYCTIGFGHLVKKARCDGSEPERFRSGLPRPEAVDLLRRDMGMAEQAVVTLAQVELNDGQFAALCDFTYNVGRGALARSTLLKYLNTGDFEKIPAQLRRYVYAAGRRLEGLARRREREIELFFEGQVVPRGVPGPDEDVSPIDILAIP